MPDKDYQSKRILGDLRIFQAVYNDLVKAEVWHQADDNAYYYKQDPYNFEDNKFPATIKAIDQLVAEERQKEREKVLNELEKSLPTPGSRLSNHDIWNQGAKTTVDYIKRLIASQRNQPSEKEMK